MIIYLSLLVLSLSSLVFAQSTTTTPEVNTDGFDDRDANLSHHQQSWLQENDRYIFIIVLSILFLAIITYYVVRSIRGMRQRLSKDNQAQMMMIQGPGHNSGISETVPVDNNGFQKMPDYPSPHQQQKEQYVHRY